MCVLVQTKIRMYSFFKCATQSLLSELNLPRTDLSSPPHLQYLQPVTNIRKIPLYIINNCEVKRQSPTDRLTPEMHNHSESPFRSSPPKNTSDNNVNNVNYPRLKRIFTHLRVVSVVSKPAPKKSAKTCINCSSL